MPAGARGRARRPVSSTASRPSIEQRHQRRNEGSVGEEIDAVDLHSREGLTALGAAAPGAARIFLPQATIAGVDMNDAGGLRILERNDPDVRKLELAWVVQDERDDVVLPTEHAHRGIVDESHVQKIRDEEDHAALLGDVREKARGVGHLGPYSPRLREQELADHLKEV